MIWQLTNTSLFDWNIDTCQNSSRTDDKNGENKLSCNVWIEFKLTSVKFKYWGVTSA